MKSIIKKPLLAHRLDDLSQLSFPCFATPKIDGIRALKLNGKMVSRSIKPIKNVTMRVLLESLLPDESDGEIFVEGTFQDVQHSVMMQTGSDKYTGIFTYYWFDYVKDDPEKPYIDRIADMKVYIEMHPEILNHPQAKIIPLYPVEMTTIKEISDYETKILKDNFEGVMIRNPKGIYKMGRSTGKDGILLKLKKFDDAEATVIGVQELMKNTNEKTTNALGASQRSSKKAGLIPMNKLGSLLVENAKKQQFSIGSGFNEFDRQELWAEKDKLVGRLVKYKFFAVGEKDAPRFPTFIGFRDADDL